MSEHTQGPYWVEFFETIVGSKNAVGMVFSPLGEDLAIMANHEISLREISGNASLFAASHDLLEALIMVRDADNDCRSDNLPTIPAKARAKIDAAIAKAGGRA